MAKVNLGQTRPIHVSESYTSQIYIPECAIKPAYEGNFCME